MICWFLNFILYFFIGTHPIITILPTYFTQSNTYCYGGINLYRKLQERMYGNYPDSRNMVLLDRKQGDVTNDWIIDYVYLFGTETLSVLKKRSYTKLKSFLEKRYKYFCLTLLRLRTEDSYGLESMPFRHNIPNE